MSQYWGACQIFSDRKVSVFTLVVNKHVVWSYLEIL